MDKVLEVVEGFHPDLKDDDSVDRLNSRWTVIILMIFCVVVAGETYVGTPIKCWAPQHFTDSHEKYMNNFCWVKNTYYYPMQTDLPLISEGDEGKHFIPYYQWIPFILLIQAVLFYFPSVIWRSFNQSAGIDADNILKAAFDLEKVIEQDIRENSLGVIVQLMHRYLISRSKNRKVFFICSRRYGCYLLVLYLFSKLLYLTNVTIQFLSLSYILGTSYGIYGIRAIYEFRSLTTPSNPTFPRVTMCDFRTRRLGNVHRYTVQCCLPINMYNEKVYVFLWFWFLFVALLTTLNLLLWIVRSLWYGGKVNYIFNHLSKDDRESLENTGNSKRLQKFVTRYLRSDGVFLIRLINHNMSKRTTDEITSMLFNLWTQEFNDTIINGNSMFGEDQPDNQLFDDEPVNL
ncbi:unnamed protein product [Dimorphilus gyrociliatus]|uniref:Innexin n=1 Tax=Dimorphilus gyrociliatus TaxID=2664684 RepID=A0A7I8WDA8_9ANNE|nr:unnamed protein product [Dimorphilus gyrociliatus]